MNYDLLIIGCGPAGMTAAIYAARAQKKVLVIDNQGIGGQIAKSPLVENYPGKPNISGMDLAFETYDQMIALGVDYEFNEIKAITHPGEVFEIELEDSVTHTAKAIIVATGASPRELNVPGGKEYTGKGIYYCVVCDGPLFTGKEVLVVGSGNTGAQYALELKKYCSKVKICDVTPDLFCEPMLAEKIRQSDIEIYLSAKICRVTKDDNDKMVVIFEGGSEVVVDGIFVAIGQKPSTDFIKGIVELDEKGYIVSDDLTTAVDGIFVAGDCRTKKVRQAITAASDGAEAALLAIKYIDDKE